VTDTDEWVSLRRDGRLIQPKKYLDAARTEINPDWMQWARAAAQDWCDDTYNDYSTYFPEEYGKAIPDEGAWIMVLDVPHTELSSRFEVPVMSTWRARRHSCNFGHPQSGKTVLPFTPQQAVISTPGGDLHLWPHEYTIISDVSFMIGAEPEFDMITLGGEPLFDDPVLAERLFYIQSRGISRHEAGLLTLNDQQAPDFVYFVMHPELAAMWEGVGVPLWRHMVKHPRKDNKPFKVKLTVEES
jgi:hypothetical protein